MRWLKSGEDMKVLLLVQKEQRIILDALYEAIAANCNCDIRWLDSDQQSDLKSYFARQVDSASYDRIVLFLRFKKEIRQVRFLRTIPNLVFLEHDAYQNYMDCKYQGKFTRLYQQLPWVRVLSSGAGVVAKLQKEGTDAVFVPKGYDHTMLYNQGKERDIELGFLGSIESKAYTQRKRFLQAIAEKENLIVKRTESGDSYLQMLNRIKFFIGCDKGMGEYMIKNFEAMACGCVVFAADQGDYENKVLGFIDMENIVLYNSEDEFFDKLTLLRNNPEWAQSIVKQGMKLASTQYTFEKIGEKVVAALKSKLREPVQKKKWLGLF